MISKTLIPAHRGPPFTEHVGNTFSTTDASSYSFTAGAFGSLTENHDRYIVVGMAYRGDFNDVAIVSATIGGVAADLYQNLDTGFVVQQAVIWARVPLGTISPAVSITLSGTSRRIGVSMWTLRGLQNAQVISDDRQKRLTDTSITAFGNCPANTSSVVTFMAQDSLNAGSVAATGPNSTSLDGSVIFIGETDYYFGAASSKNTQGSTDFTHTVFTWTTTSTTYINRFSFGEGPP